MQNDPWPATLVPDLERVDVALSRTDPAFAGRAEVREVERLYLDSIAAARRHIYIENQYFTSSAITDALAARLEEEDGPELVLVLPRSCSGWLEEGTMGLLRGRAFRRLQEADRHGRLAAYYPRLGGEGCPTLNVHAKVMIVDDLLVRIASSNLSNRSMGLDTELDLTLEATDDARVGVFAGRLRSRLLGEHLGLPPERVAGVLERTGSLIRTIEELRGGDHTLEPLEPDEPGWLERAMPANAVLDLERPLEQTESLSGILPGDGGESAIHAGVRALRLAVVMLAIVTVWTWTRVDFAAASDRLPDPAILALVVGAAFIVGGALMVPASLLILTTLLVLGARPGFFYSLAGLTAAAIAGWTAGRLAWRRGRALAGPYFERMAWRLGTRRDLRALASVRLFPVAPFTVISIVCGALGARLDRFMLATLVGSIPSVAILALLIRALGG